MFRSNHICLPPHPSLVTNNEHELEETAWAVLNLRHLIGKCYMQTPSFCLSIHWEGKTLGEIRLAEAWEMVKDWTSQAQITCQGFGPGSPFHFGFALGFVFLTLVLQLYTEKLMKMCKHHSVFLPFNVPIRLKFSRWTQVRKKSRAGEIWGKISHTCENSAHFYCECSGNGGGENMKPRPQFHFDIKVKGMTEGTLSTGVRWGDG